MQKYTIKVARRQIAAVTVEADSATQAISMFNDHDIDVIEEDEIDFSPGFVEAEEAYAFPDEQHLEEQIKDKFMEIFGSFTSPSVTALEEIKEIIMHDSDYPNHNQDDIKLGIVNYINSK